MRYEHSEPNSDPNVQPKGQLYMLGIYMGIFSLGCREAIQPFHGLYNSLTAATAYVVGSLSLHGKWPQDS